MSSSLCRICEKRVLRENSNFHSKPSSRGREELKKGFTRQNRDSRNQIQNSGCVYIHERAIRRVGTKNSSVKYLNVEKRGEALEKWKMNNCFSLHMMVGKRKRGKGIFRKEGGEENEGR